MKKVIHIGFITLSLLACLVFMAGDTIDLFVFKYQQSKVRKEMKLRLKRGVDEKELHTFTFHVLDRIEWTKPGKEFRSDNHLYDIVSFKLKNGTIVFKCVSDDQETELFTQLENRINQKLSENPANGDYFKFLIKDFVKNMYAKNHSHLNLPVANHLFFYLGQKVYSFSSVPSDPPELLV